MIGRVALSLSAAVTGMVIGAALVLASGGAPGATTTSPSPSPLESPAPTPGSDTASDPGPPDDVQMPQTAGALLLAWTVAGLPDGFATAASEIQGVTQVTEVVAGRLNLTSSRDSTGTLVDRSEPGWAIPIDAIAVDPATFSTFVPTGQRPIIERLEPGTVILGETSATVRDLDVGGQLEIGADTNHTVVGILDDASIGAAEVVLHRSDGLAARMAPKYLLLRHDDQRPSVEAALREAAGDRPLRVRALGETPYLRHGDAVLPQAIVKLLYGEFQYRPPGAGERAFDVDPTWVSEHIVTRQVPILGTVTCHRIAIESIDAILTELDRLGLAHAVDPDGFAGCWNPRLIAEGGDLSRHAWGIAVDINAEGNPTGTGSGQHDAIVELFTRSGWGWGGSWLVPDPMHFELVTDPTDPIKIRP